MSKQKKKKNKWREIADRIEKIMEDTFKEEKMRKLKEKLEKMDEELNKRGIK